MHLEIISPDKVIYTGNIESITLPGKEGYFEILNSHAPLIALLKEGNIKYAISKEDVRMLEISQGFVEVNNNKVTVLV